MFTRQHYELIAERVAQSGVGQLSPHIDRPSDVPQDVRSFGGNLYRARTSLALVFSLNDPDFDSSRFFKNIEDKVKALRAGP